MFCGHTVLKVVFGKRHEDIPVDEKFEVLKTLGQSSFSPPQLLSTPLERSDSPIRLISIDFHVPMSTFTDGWISLGSMVPPCNSTVPLVGTGTFSLRWAAPPAPRQPGRASPWRGWWPRWIRTARACRWGGGVRQDPGIDRERGLKDGKAKAGARAVRSFWGLGGVRWSMGL